MIPYVLSMEIHHRIEVVEGAAGPLLRKRALTPTGTERLQQEADRLDRAGHLAVVTLVEVGDDRIDLAWAGAETLALARLTRGDAARTLGAVAATIADLHDLGIVHGRLDETHVVLGPGLRPRLCGLRGHEPGRAEVGPADDVADLGMLLQRALGMGADPDLVPEHRWRTWPRTSHRDRTLEDLAERAADPDPARRPTARALALALAEVVPGIAELLPDRDGARGGRAKRQAPASDHGDEVAPAAREVGPPDQVAPGPEGLESGLPPAKVAARLSAARSRQRPVDRVAVPSRPLAPQPAGGLDEPTPEPPPGPDGLIAPSRRRSLPLLAIAGAGIGIALTGMALAARQPATRPPATAGSPLAAASRGSIVTTGEVRPDTEATSSTAESTGRRDSVEGRTVEVGGRRYEVGEPGDRVSVADWDCDGSATAGLVRPETGEVFLFGEWPTTGAVAVAARTRIAGAVALDGWPPGPACRTPRVLLDTGGWVSLPTEIGR